MTFSLATGVVFAQYDRDHNRNNNNNPPSSVQRSWQKDYPNYQNNTWDYRDSRWHTRYQDRDHNNRDVDVYYDRYGRRIMLQSQWDRNELPERVRERLRSRYHANDNYNVYRIERPGRGFYFQITLGGNRKIYLDERGREVRYY